MFSIDVFFYDSIVALATLTVMGFYIGYLVRKVSPSKVKNPSTATTLIDFVLSKLIEATEDILGRRLFEKHGSFLIFLFFAVFFLNLVGLIPGMPAPTTNPAIVLGLALLSFIYFNYYGIKEHGIYYFKHMGAGLLDMGLPFKIIGAFVLIFELISICLRLFSLTLRLVIAVTVDHKIVELFVTSDFGLLFGFIPVAFVFYFVGLFVSFIQAYVFYFLNCLYVYLALEHEDH
ncbi:MAG: F0F1 ATP synthase subunit A [Deltaproteobacteria bacterium]|nr:F0F1 ATP synthase subunit A [Deltaproteobacteria bacterium]